MKHVLFLFGILLSPCSHAGNYDQLLAVYANMTNLSLDTLPSQAKVQAMFNNKTLSCTIYSLQAIQAGRNIETHAANIIVDNNNGITLNLLQRSYNLKARTKFYYSESELPVYSEYTVMIPDLSNKTLYVEYGITPQYFRASMNSVATIIDGQTRSSLGIMECK